MAVSVLLWVPGSQTCSAATSPGPRPHWLWGSCLSAVCADPQAGMSLSPPFPWALCWAHRFLGPSVEASRCCFKGHFFCKLFPPAFPESAPQASAAEIRAFVCNLTLLAGLRAVLRSWRGGKASSRVLLPRERERWGNVSSSPPTSSRRPDHGSVGDRPLESWACGEGRGPGLLPHPSCLLLLLCPPWAALTCPPEALAAQGVSGGRVKRSFLFPPWVDVWGVKTHFAQRSDTFP